MNNAVDLAQARSADKPVMIVTPEEAANAEKTKASGKKTWVFKSAERTRCRLREQP